MSVVKSSLALAAALAAFAASSSSNTAQAQDGRVLSRCAMQCSSSMLQDSCVQRCESEHETGKKKIKIVKIPPPKNDPVPKIFVKDNGGDGNGGGGGGRGK